jgi:hypothetical protein
MPPERRARYGPPPLAWSKIRRRRRTPADSLTAPARHEGRTGLDGGGGKLAGQEETMHRSRPCRRNACRRNASPWLVASTLVLALIALLPGAAVADAWSAMKGRIFVSDSEYGSGYATDGAMISAVKKQSKTAITGGGAWTLNLMVFLKEAPGAASINIVYYDVSVKPREQVNFSEVSVKPDQKMVQLNGIAISKDLGFVTGHKYDVVATRLVGGKEKVYAKTTITLK